jgi:hypothetical protein
LNLILILKELWRRKVLVALSVFLAAAVSVLAVYQVSVSPPSISQRAQVSAQGSIEILVDSARSPIADARRDLEGLTARAGVIARLMAGGNVIDRIAKDAGIPAKKIDVVGPTPLPGQAPGVAAAPPQLRPYGIAITQSGELPIVGVVTRAPTVGEARDLAAAAPAAVSQEVESIQAQQDTPAKLRVEFRELGPAQAALVDDAKGKKIALVLFLVVLVLCLGLILGGPRLVHAWRTAEADALPVEPEGEEAGEAPAVVHLPAGRGGETERDDSTSRWRGRREES